MSPFRLLASLAAASLIVSTPVSAQTPVKFSLDWRFETPNSGFMVALDKGYYKAEGLDVTIDPGNGSVDGINRVASGSYNLAMADMNSLIRFRDNPANPPLKAVFMLMNAPAFAVTSLRKSGIQKPKDLEGRLVGAPAADGAFANWAAFVKAAGIDGSKVRIENVGFPVREPMLMQGKVDAVVGFGYSAWVALQSNGFKPEDISIMYMRDFGLELFGNALLVNPQYLRDNPEVVRKFVRASIRGFMDAAANPADAVASVLKRNPVTTEAAERMRLAMFMNDNFLTAEVKANGVGFVDPSRLRRSIDQIGESFKFTSKPRIEDLYTDEFLPPAAERAVPAAIAAKKF
jgi:NitT/TauT family transport system substrate-binding protein